MIPLLLIPSFKVGSQSNDTLKGHKYNPRAYRLQNDTLVCFTKQESLRALKVVQKEPLYKSIIKDQDSIINYQDSNLTYQNNIIKIKDNQISKVIEDNTNIKKDNINIKQKQKKTNTIYQFTIAILIVLSIIY